MEIYGNYIIKSGNNRVHFLKNHEIMKISVKKI